MKLAYAAFVVGTLAAANTVSAEIIPTAGIAITEVDPFGASNGYGASWFELTDVGPHAASTQGLSMADNRASSDPTDPYAPGQIISSAGSNRPLAPLNLVNGPVVLQPGQSAIFLESPADAADSQPLIQAFEQAWFGNNVPSGLLIGVYNDTSLGNYPLSGSDNMVNIFDGTQSNIASVRFLSDGSTLSTFDNAAGLNDVTLTQRSVAGENGAFVSASGTEIGSPGTIGVVPLPGASGLLLSGLGALGLVVLGRRKLPALPG
jgi:hypothetical protein